MEKRNRFKGAFTRILLAFLQNFAKIMIKVPSLTQRMPLEHQEGDIK